MPRYTCYICTALAPTRPDIVSTWESTLRPVSWLTRPYLIAIEPFRRILYPAMLRRIRRAWLAAYGLAQRRQPAER